MLNGIYYNRTSGTCYKGEALWDSPSALECDYENGSVKGLSSEARSLIGDAVWYLGVSSTYEGLYADDYYNSERGTKVPLEEFPTSTVAKLGIMYPSDYVYAVDLSKNIRTGDEIYEVEILEEEIEEIHWLYGSYEWLISPFSFNGHATMISWRNIIMWDSAGETDVNVATYVRPVAVLKPNVMITGGSGTSGEPYRLVLG